MFSGAQFSLYPMSDDFVDIILGALGSLDPYRDRLRVETDPVSTLLVGPPDIVLAALRDVFVTAAAGGVHCALTATLSRGCPGEADDPICAGGPGRPPDRSLPDRIQDAVAAVAAATSVGRPVDAQLSVYPLGAEQHMDEIYGCIDFLKRSAVFAGPKHFCTRLSGDAGPVFAAVQEAFTRFGAPDGHLAVDLTVSANSPSTRRPAAPSGA